MQQNKTATPAGRMAYFEKLLKRLCSDIGPRPSGSKAYEKSAEIIHRELSAALPTAFMDPYLDFWTTLPKPEIIHKGTRLKVEVAENCAGTSNAGINGIIKKIRKKGIPYGIEDRETGKIAAYIKVGRESAALPEYLFGDDVLSLPRFIIGIRDIPFVELLIKNKSPVQARLETLYAPKTPTFNIVGTLPGKRPDEILFIAHADTLIQTEGANDNTATAIIMLMLAHAFSGTTPEYTLTFLISGSEEYGQKGAGHYAKRRVLEGTHKYLKFIVNSDSLTYGPNLWTTTEDAELIDLIKKVHADLDMDTDPIYSSGSSWINDAKPFRNINPHVRGVNFNSRGHDTLAANHTPDDNAANVPRDCVESAFLILKEFINQLQTL